MRYEKEVVCNRLIKQIETFYSRDFEDTVTENIFKKHNVNKGFIKNFLNGEKSLMFADEVYLYLLAKEIESYESEKENNIRVGALFHDVEIADYENYYEDKKEIKSELVLKSVTKLADDMFVTILSYKEISELYSNGYIDYNFVTQRNPKYTKGGASDINLNYRAVHEIKNEMLKGSFIPNIITFNMLEDGELAADYKFNENEGILKINTNNTEIDILDGMHRSVGLMKALKLNPDLTGRMMVYFTNFSVDKARKYIVQEDKRNKINNAYIKSLDINLYSTLINAINTDKDSELEGKITPHLGTVKLDSNIAYVSFETMNKALERYFPMRKKSDVRRYTKKFIEDFNWILEEFEDEFMEKSRLNNDKSFIIYLYLLSITDDKEVIKNKIEKFKDAELDEEIIQILYKREVSIKDMERLEEVMNKI